MGARSPEAPDPSARPSRKKAAPRELSCKVKVGRRAELRVGTAALGQDALHFHTGRTGRQGNDFSLHLRYDEITEAVVDAHAGTLTVSTAEHRGIVFHLGRHAPEWKTSLERRPSLLDDLGIRSRARGDVVGIDDDQLASELEARGVSLGGEGDLDFLLVGAQHRADLSRLGALAARVRRPGGVLWLVYDPKARGLTERDLAAGARAAGLLIGDTVALSRARSAVALW